MEGAKRLDFDYLEKFMVDCFLAAGDPVCGLGMCSAVNIRRIPYDQICACVLPQFGLNLVHDFHGYVL